MVTLFMSLFTIQQRYKIIFRVVFSCTCAFFSYCGFILVRFFPCALLSECAFFPCAYIHMRFFPVRFFPMCFFPVRFFPVTIYIYGYICVLIQIYTFIVSISEQENSFNKRNYLKFFIKKYKFIWNTIYY